jgi:Flp pilus assembly protein TadD
MSPVVVLIAFGQVQSPSPARPGSLDCAAVVAAESHDQAVARFKTGEAAILASKWPAAEAALIEAVAFDPLLAIAHYGLGQTYMSLQRFPEAVRAFDTAREAFRCAPLSPEDRERRTDQIRELREVIRSMDERRLKEVFAKWKEMNGDVTTAASKIRTIQDAERRLAELEASLKDPDPSPPAVTLALGTALFQTGAIAEADAAFRAVIARDPQSGDAHHNLALVCTITDRLDEAEREIAASEKAGVPTHPRLKEELERRKRLRAPR